MTMNTELIARTMNRIEANPSAWNQMGWDTCFAGTAMKEAGYAIEDHFFVNPDAPSSEKVSIRTAAKETLGLTDWQALKLFAGSNRLEDLRRITAELIGDAAADEITEALENNADELVDA